MRKNKTLSDAKRVKNDEFYTQYTFSYNARGEVVFSRRGAENAENLYAYDDIGNLVSNTTAATTNIYASNNRNQYASIQEISALSASLREINYDLDGNMTRHGEWTYAYDSGNRLVSVASNGITIASMSYDTQGRRVKKVAADGTHRYFYDGWLLVYEHIVRPNSTTNEIEYVWGKDVSGTHDGAAGIGGLLYLTVSNSNSELELYVPWYDAYGNILGYRDAQGNVVASYTYDAFGNIIGQSGTMADTFSFRFSTKCFDADCGLYYYGYRHYKPQIMCWLTEDPIGEEGGANLHSPCLNNLVCSFDALGLLTYSQLSANYPRKNQYKTDVNAATNIWELVGGKVLINARSGIFENSCTIRLSHALNKSGDLIPFISGKTSSGKNPPKWWYIFRVKDMKGYLEGKYGQPTVYSNRKQFEKCAPKGILVLDVPGWSDASGHATLWDGTTTIDEAKDEYFGKRNVKFNLWRLK